MQQEARIDNQRVLRDGNKSLFTHIAEYTGKKDFLVL